MTPAKMLLACFVILTCLAAFSVQAKQSSGDPKHGKELYDSICTGCHSLDANRVGPMHRGVYGRKAGSVAGYDYSPALKHSGLTWNTATLNKWLAGPEKLVPGQKMNIQMDSPLDRADVIAYLKSAH
ncbi:c-type cytochrome [Fundidesulfovibrio terrae]|uniref:c-type cytochrome n=1 Tax=Fundidesulfovibrio terrae TaxID=2922866 RepID=UPI001FAF3CF8|nr:c-type cytochrome [Fundidesulfovibrio terrae]